MNFTTIWKRLDCPGHDAVCIWREPDGWTINGHAVFYEKGVTAARYRVVLDAQFRTLSATIDGFRAGASFRHVLVCAGEKRTLDDRPQNGLVGMRHLDLGFTPATNWAQLRAEEPGEREHRFEVAWFDLDRTALEPLTQIYRKSGDRRFSYQSPANGYQSTLVVDDHGLIVDYPGLWVAEVAD